MSNYIQKIYIIIKIHTNILDAYEKFKRFTYKMC